MVQRLKVEELLTEQSDGGAKAAHDAGRIGRMQSNLIVMADAPLHDPRRSRLTPPHERPMPARDYIRGVKRAGDVQQPTRKWADADPSRRTQRPKDNQCCERNAPTQPVRRRHLTRMHVQRQGKHAWLCPFNAERCSIVSLGAELALEASLLMPAANIAALPAYFSPSRATSPPDSIVRAHLICKARS